MKKNDDSPFKALKGLKIKKKKDTPPAVAKAVEKASEPGPALDEASLFARAMSGVTPIAEETRGREVPPPAPEPPKTAADIDEEALSQLYDLVSGKVEFELSFTDEYAQGFVRGIDQKIFRQLAAGQFSPEAHIDLHGQNADQAKSSVLHFVRERYLAGNRCLLLIPGRGVNSPGGQPILKKEIENWLTRDPLRRVVLAFCTALPRHGGAGALYVLLRKYKKTKGKVRWESHWDTF